MCATLCARKTSITVGSLALSPSLSIQNFCGGLTNVGCVGYSVISRVSNAGPLSEDAAAEAAAIEDFRSRINHSASTGSFKECSIAPENPCETNAL